MIKTDRDYPKCNPEFALMDPTYTYTVPTHPFPKYTFVLFSKIKLFILFLLYVI